MHHLFIPLNRLKLSLVTMGALDVLYNLSIDAEAYDFAALALQEYKKRVYLHSTYSFSIN